jgi:hypothetical protein
MQFFFADIPAAMYFAVESALCNIKMFFMYAAFQAFLFIFKDTPFFFIF